MPDAGRDSDSILARSNAWLTVAAVAILSQCRDRRDLSRSQLIDTLSRAPL